MTSSQHCRLRGQCGLPRIALLNKTDLVSVEQVDFLESYIHTVKQGARIIRSQHGQVPLPLILDVGYNDPKAYTKMLETQDAHHHHEHSEHEHHDHEHTHHDHHHSDHLANDGFVSVSFTSDRPFSLKKFQDFQRQFTYRCLSGQR